MPEPLRNTVTPRIFVAATRQDDGKTTTSVGLFAALQKRFADIGYIKPVGQRFVDVEGLKIDEDSVLINETYRVRSPLRAMSPIAVEPDFTRRYLSGGNRELLHHRVVEAFDEASWEKDFMIIEGTGHAGVGSVFDLSNATVASLLRSKVIIVSRGGIGAPVDEICLNLALFEKQGVEVIGAILNKVLPDKLDNARDFVAKALARLGLPLLGVIPMHQELRKPTLNQVAREIRGEFIAGGEHKRRRVGKIIVGAMSPRHAEDYFAPGGLLITTGDREDLIMLILGEASEQALAPTAGGGLAGVVLADGKLPAPALLDLMRQKGVPFIASRYDVYTVASAINRTTVKTEASEKEKIALIQHLVQTHVDIDKIISAGGAAPERPAVAPLTEVKTVPAAE